MNAEQRVGPRVVEASTVLVPAPGVDVYQALRDAELSGFVRIEINADNTATVVWYEES